jgi:hypothetical protein
MAIKHTNRKGKTYYLYQGVTKKGNPRYYFAQKSEGELVDRIPEGFEIYENPNAQVFLRRIRPKLITDAEIEIVRHGMEKYCRQKHYQIDVKKDVISIFLPDQNVDVFSELLAHSPKAGEISLADMINQFTTYSPMLRFVLRDEKRRRFMTQRYCFFGSIDDWIEIGKSDDLARLVKRYVKHLGLESYYELY